jgi:hypothetical protein
VVAKHRRAEAEPAGQGYLPPNGYDQNTYGASSYGGNGYGGAYDGGAYDGNGYGSAVAEPDWAAVPQGNSEQDWQAWGPPPAMHPDHPSAPVPRVQLPDDYQSDYPSGPLPPPYGPGQPGPAAGSSGTWSAPPPGPDAGYYRDSRPLRVVPNNASVADYGPPALRSPRYEPPQYSPPQPPPAPQRSGGQHSRPPAAGRAGSGLWASPETSPFGPAQAEQMAREAQHYAAATREAAEREAAAIREAAQREAAELRAGLDSMTGELGRVAAYITEHFAAPAMSAAAPALPGVRPALPGPRPALPAAQPPQPDAGPARPDTRPGPARPAPARPAEPNTPPARAAKKPQKPGRQRQAMRIATYATAALLLFSVVTGIAEIAANGFGFFAFRGGGVGQTPGEETDQQFLAHQHAAHHVVVPPARPAKK